MMAKYSEPFLLSSKGSTRATAYGFSNKSVTLDGKTHVVWLDVVSRVCGRTYDQASRSWSETFFLGEGQDNHATPVLSVDRDRHLRLVYGPHSRGWNTGRFKWFVSEHPNRIDAWVQPDRWTEEENFGYCATYASMTHMPQGVDAIVYRGGDYPQAAMFQHERKLGGWTKARAIMYQDITPQYTNYGAICSCDSDGTLYVACHFYNVGGDMQSKSAPVEGQKSYGVAIVKTSDLGETWTDMQGDPVNVPALYSGQIAVPPVDANMRIGGLALDSKGDPWTLTFKPEMDVRDLLLSHWTGRTWDVTDLADHLPDGWVATGGGVSIDTEDRIHVAVMAANADAVAATPGVKAWGHPSSEVFHMLTDVNTDSVQCHQISTTDGSTANWLPNMSRAGAYHPVEKPVILYTHGIKGVGCSPTEENGVYCVMVEDVA